MVDCENELDFVRMNWTLGLCAQLFFEVDCQTLGLCDSCSMVDCQKWTLGL